MTIERTSTGATRLARLDDGRPLFVTVNWDADGRPLELFVRLDDPDLHEWVTALTRFVSMALREGLPLGLIIEELEAVHSAKTRHVLPGSTDVCPSLVARIGAEVRRAFDEGPGLAMLYERHTEREGSHETE